jgi:hypothetical protein
LLILITRMIRPKIKTPGFSTRSTSEARLGGRRTLILNIAVGLPVLIIDLKSLSFQLCNLTFHDTRLWGTNNTIKMCERCNRAIIFVLSWNPFKPRIHCASDNNLNGNWISPKDCCSIIYCDWITSYNVSHICGSNIKTHPQMSSV